MKQLLAVLLLTTAFSAQAVDSRAADVAKADEAKAKTKQVCKDVVGKDNKPVKNKDGSVKQACKTIKVHKKHEGTEIPPKK
jgi:azurin